MKKKILIISSEFLPDPGGIGNHAYHLAKSLSAESYDVTVLADIAHTGVQAVDDFKKELSFYFVPVIRKKIVLLTYAQRIKLAVSLSSNKDCIICSGKFSLWLIYLIRLFDAKKRAIAIVHGSELQLPSKAQRNIVSGALKKFNSIIAVSNYTKSFIPETVREEVECAVIPNGIDTAEFASVRRVREFSGQLALITIGSVTERKGQENVINAIPGLLKYFPGLVYHIIGSPVITERLRQLCLALSVGNNVVFHGKLCREKLLRLLDQSSVKIMLSNHTSTGDFEGFGIAVLEANACGLPAIASGAGGTTDAVAEGFSGRLVDPFDTLAIAEALKDIISNYCRYSSNAIEWADEHDWEIIIQQYVALIEKGN